MRFFVSCAKGLEYLLVDELTALGGVKATATMAGVNVEGHLLDAQRAVLWSRLASRVLWPLAQFDCADEHALYTGTRRIDWPHQLTPEMTLAVDAHVSGKAITHARFAAQRVKDAVVDVLREATGMRPGVDTQSPDVRLNLVIRKGQAIVSIDLGGGPLHRRGWRKAQGAAPLKENLAAAVLLRGGWPQRYANGGSLLDPMCGSGTLLIEGALMAAGIAPGLLRHGDHPPTRWPGFDRSGWQQLCEEARQRETRGRAALRPAFHGSDHDPNAIATARENAIAAGVDHALTLAVRDLAHTPPAPFEGSPGLVVSNPPYDERLPADPALYRRLGDTLSRCAPGWAASILCGSPDLAFATGLRAKKPYRLFNGALECTLLVCDPIKSLAREPATPRPLSKGAQMVANRLNKTLRKLRSWREREAITCWRIYDADIPEYAAAIDIYTEADSGQCWLHIQEYAAPAGINPATAKHRFSELLAGAGEALGIPRERIAIKTRQRDKGGRQYGRFAARGEFLTVREGDVRLRVNLFDYLDTGLFLDHRPLRLRLAAEAHDTRFLNLFAYTGAATVHAAIGGARSTTTVDLSGTYLQWCADNLAENSLVGARHTLVQADVMQWLRAERKQYDLIFCDPPTFSNSARARDFNLQHAHVALLQTAVDRLAPDGVLYFSNNFRRFKLDDTAVSTFAHCEEISPATIAQDFARNPRIHRVWRLTHDDHPAP